LRKVYRIGVLETTSVALNAANITAFHQGMRERGYQEGRDYEIEYRFASGDTGRYPALAAELVGRHHVDLIVTRGTPSVLAAKNATTTIPIVMAAIGDAFEAVSSLAHPGGTQRVRNRTGSETARIAYRDYSGSHASCSSRQYEQPNVGLGAR
jgi:putative ABC transport system substrate-binding protein